MAICGFLGRLRAGARPCGVKILWAITKPFNYMSLAGALRSRNAEEFALTLPVGENNWKSRLGFCETLNTAINDAPNGVLPGSFEPYITNLIDAIICERTQLSVAACRLAGVLPKVTSINPFLDRLLPALIRQCANTKTVAQKSASSAIIALLLNSPYNHRSLYHICQAFEEKYLAPKIYAPLWLKTIIQNYSGALNQDRDYAMISKAIAVGLEEADVNARINNRACFWEYYKIHPTGADEIMDKLNTHGRAALVNDPNNPDKTKQLTKKQEQDSALAKLKKEKLKQKAAAERKRMVSATTITSEDFPMGAFDMPEPDLGRYPTKAHVTTAPLPDHQPTISKSTSRPIAIHKKGSSLDEQIPTTTKKVTSTDHGHGHGPGFSHPHGHGHYPKKIGSADSLRTSQNKKPSSITVPETSTSRPLLSAPVRRPRIVATPMNNSQSSSRPTSRAGALPTSNPSTDPVLRGSVSHKELRAGPTDITSSETQNAHLKPSKKAPRATPPLLVPDGKENDYIHTVIAKRNHPSSPDRLKTLPDRNAGPVAPPREVAIKPDGLTAAQRLKHQELDREIREMVPHMPEMATRMCVQDEEKLTQMYLSYPALNHDGQIDQARRAFEKALEYLHRDALDQMGFRKLRKLLEQFGRDLIVDQALYDLLWSHLLPRIGSVDELLAQPLEADTEDHPRYIRNAVLTMINILVHAYPFEWSYQYQGPALAAIMMARCAYSVNCDYHPGATYIKSMTIVNQLNVSMRIIVDACLNPIATMDSVIEVLSMSEDYLMRLAPHDSENIPSNSWASFNPYSKINRLRSEQNGDIFHPQPINLDTFEIEDPKPLPRKLLLLMETGLEIIKALIIKAKREEFRLDEDREDILASLARHLMSSYNVIIGRQVMEYCLALYKSFESPDRFWTYFPEDSERNLLHYYLSRAS